MTQMIGVEIGDQWTELPRGTSDPVVIQNKGVVDMLWSVNAAQPADDTLNYGILVPGEFYSPTGFGAGEKIWARVRGYAIKMQAMIWA